MIDSYGMPCSAHASPHPRAPELSDGASGTVWRRYSRTGNTTRKAPKPCFAHIPGIRVVIPSSPSRAYGLLLAAIRDPDPVVFLEPKRIYRYKKEEVVDDGEELPLDVCYVLRDGTDITLVTWGAMVKETLEAADQLQQQGISAEVIDVATVSPIDMETIIESVEKTGRCVIVHEAARHCGIGAEIAANLADSGIYNLHAPVKRVTGYDTVMPLFKMEMKYLPSVQRILNAVNEVMEVS